MNPIKKLLSVALLVAAPAASFAQSDLCSGAPTLTSNSSCSYTNYSLPGTWGAELPATSCGPNYRDGFFKFVATSAITSIHITDDLGGPDPLLAVYSSCGGTAIACSDNGNNVNETVTISTTVGQTYYIAIMRTNNANNNATSGMICVKQGSAPVPPTDCPSATQVCNTASFSGNASGYGTQELTSSNEGCLFGENQSSWYYFQAVTSGTVAFTIVTSADYDFALWGGSCGNLGTPLRCSYAGTHSNTGLQSGLSQTSEGSGGDGFVSDLNVTAGQTYILLIDNFSVDNTPFTLNWNFSGGATLNCTPVTLPVEFVEFIGKYENRRNELSWITASEKENDFFTIERSVDGISWVTIAEPNAEGNSFTLNEYAYTDYSFLPNTINYYRLSQTDMDGKSETYYKIVAIDDRQEAKKVVHRYNLLGQEVDEHYKGVVILRFDDNSCLKIFQ